MPNLSSAVCSEVPLNNGITAASAKKCGLADAVNLSFESGCTTRTGRMPVQFLNAVPDQILSVGETVYYRFQNTLQTMQMQNGVLQQTGSIPLLENTYTSKRSILQYGQNLYIFPDNLQLHKDSKVYPFSTENTVAEKFPFTSSTTLFYPFSSEDGGDPCKDLDLLTQHTVLTFSWSDTAHTVQKREQVYQVNSSTSKFIGVQITLTPAVPNYNNIPVNATATVQTPYLHSMETICYGNPLCNYSVFENKLSLIQPAGSRHYIDSFKKYFSPGQVVRFKGTGYQALEGLFTLQAVEDDILYFDRYFETLCSFSGKNFQICSLLPQADFAVMNDERCIIADNESSAVWLSAYRDPSRYMLVPTLGTDGCKLTTANTGKFTALLSAGGEVYFFTAEKAFRIYGSNALNYQAAGINSSGLPAEFSATLCGVEKQIFYANGQHVLKYRSGGSQPISAEIFEAAQTKKAVVCSAKCYFLTLNRLYIYDPSLNKWWSDSAEGVQEIFVLENKLYLLCDQTVYTYGSAISVPWQLKTHAILGEKIGTRLTPLEVRAFVNSPKESLLKMQVTGEKETQQTVCGESFITLKLSGRPVPKFEFTLSGEEPITLQRLQLLYRRD